MDFHTIAAVSTPRGKGGVAVLRVSGPDAFLVAKRVFSPRASLDWEKIPARVQIYGDVISPEDGRVLDDGLLTLFVAPHSFTGENVAEISCHGGDVVTSMVLSALLSAGAVMAQAGEFSRRAFLNGKMSLTAAEGIADLLDARTEESARLSSKAARGRISASLEQISDKLLTVASDLWAYLDYPEEDLGAVNEEKMLALIEEILSSCRRLSDGYTMGRAVHSGIRTAIIGKPNVGKSTLFNTLLQEDRAIVTEIAGTTRDVIDAPVKMGRVLLDLSDTAGVHSETEDPIEKMGIRRSLEALSCAEMILLLFDSSRPADEMDRQVLQAASERMSNSVILPILTKCDLPSVFDAQLLEPFGEPLRLCCHDSEALALVQKRIEEAWITDEALFQEGAILANARQKAGLDRVIRLLERAKKEISSLGKDLASLTVEEAVATLLEIDGKSAADKILDQVFSRFCIGK